jgi:fibronectin-binding autotransporter adhesin
MVWVQGVRVDRKIRRAGLLAVVCLGTLPAHGQDATWDTSPGSSDWNTGSNWSSGTVPTGTATFGSSNTTAITFSKGITTVGEMLFNAGAPAYSFTTPIAFQIVITGVGIVNNSSNAPTFSMTDTEALTFENTSTAGDAIITPTFSGNALFQNTSTAGNATITNSLGGFTNFFDTSTAGNATIINNFNGVTEFFDTSTAGNSAITNNPSGITRFEDTSTAGNATIITTGSGGDTEFHNTSTAGNATITNTGGTTVFFDTSTAGNATITTNSNGRTDFLDSSTAGNVNLTVNSGGVTSFQGTSTAGNSTITTNSGGVTAFESTSTGGNARLVTNAGGIVDISSLSSGSITVGSIEGAGSYRLGAKTLTVGLNNLSTEVSGTIADGGFAGGTGGSLIKVGTGTLTLSGANTYTGTTTVTSGVLAAGSSTAFSQNSAFSVNATLDLHGYNNTIHSLVGSGSVTNNGTAAAVLTLSSDSTLFSGNLSDGTARLGLTLDAGGTMVLSGNNTYSGTTTLTSVGLEAESTTAFSPNSAFVLNGGSHLDLNGYSNSIASLSGSGDVINEGSSAAILTVGDSTSTTFSGIIESVPGTLGLTKVGTGTLTLSGANNEYTGATTVAAGTLQVTGTIARSAVTVDSGATLAGTGTIGQSVTILGGGILAPGTTSPAAIGTLTVGSLTLHSGSILNYQLGIPNMVGSGVNDLVQVNGNLTLGGTLNITNAGGFGEGLYRLFNYTGSLTNNGLTFGSLPTGFTDSDLVLQTSQAGQINLLVSASGFTDQFWDGTTKVGSGKIQGGSGTWDNVTTNWTNMDGTINAPWNNGFAIFEGTAGTVTLGANINFTGLQFMTDGYVIIARGAQELLAAVGTMIRVDSGVTATISAPIVDQAGIHADITKTDLGTLILTGTNTYSGGTTISGGILQIGNGGTTGSIIGNVTDKATFAFDRSDSVTFSGAISGPGGLNQIGTGTLVLSGNNSYSGATNVISGILQAASDTGLSPNSSFAITTTLDLNGFSNTIGSLTGSGTVTNTGATPVILTVGKDNTNTTFSGVLMDGASLGLTKIGTGTLILTGNNTYTGGTTINAGTLQIGNGGTTGSITGNVNNKSVLAFDRSDAYTFSGMISGAGGVVQAGTGALTLSGDNIYSGGTTVESGTLVVDNASALGTGNVTVTGGVLTADPQPINVVGNYFQGPNGTLQLQVAGAGSGQYDYLHVTGNASLGGTLELINQNFTPQAGDILTLVQVGGALTNKFATFIDPFTTRPGLNTIDLVYSLHTVDLEFLNIGPVTPPPPRIITINFPTFAQTPNELAAAELLNAAELNPRFGNVLNLFLSQPFGDIPGDLNLISPEAFSSLYEISFSGANIQRLNLENRLDEIRAGGGTFNVEASGGTIGLQKGSPDGKTGKNPVEPVLQPVVKPMFDLWASGYGDFVHVDSDYNARGYRFTTSGFDLGFDYRFLDHFAVGVLGNYAYTWTDLRPGTITVNSGRGGLYASYFSGNYYLNAGAYGGYNTYDTNRRALFGNAIGNTDGSEWSGFISTGYDFHTRKNLTIGPVASLQYTSVNVSGFTEQGSLVPMSIHSGSEESLRTDIGFKASYQWQVGRAVVQPYFKAEWEHEFKYSALPVTASLAGFPGPDETFVGPVEGQDSAIVSAGVSVEWTPKVSSFVGYDGQLGRGRYDSNAVNGGVRVSW